MRILSPHSNANSKGNELPHTDYTDCSTNKLPKWAHLPIAHLEVLRGAHAAEAAADHDTDARAESLDL